MGVAGGSSFCGHENDDHLLDVATFEDGQDGQDGHLGMGDHLRESCANKDTAVATSLPLDVLDWPAELQEDFEERAAIMEWDGGFSEKEAEREAKKRLLASAGVR